MPEWYSPARVRFAARKPRAPLSAVCHSGQTGMRRAAPPGARSSANSPRQGIPAERRWSSIRHTTCFAEPSRPGRSTPPGRKLKAQRESSPSPFCRPWQTQISRAEGPPPQGHDGYWNGRHRVSTASATTLRTLPSSSSESRVRARCVRPTPPPSWRPPRANHRWQACTSASDRAGGRYIPTV